MENSEEEDDLKLVKASASLLADLENALPKLLSKPAKSGSGRRLHTRVKRRDLDYVTRLVLYSKHVLDFLADLEK